MSPSKHATPDEGKPAEERTEVEAAEAKQAAAVEAASEEAPKPKGRGRRRKGAPEAEGTATEAVTERERREAKPVAEAAAKPRRRGARAEAGDSEAAPKARRTRGRRTETPAAPASRAKRPARDYGDNPPMVRAHAKYVRTSARKARLVCDHIRGKSVEEARAILAHASRDVARDWSKLLESAVANAEHNHELIGDELRIAAVKADEGPTLKRFRPRAMGRATKIRKRTSHLSITLTPKDGDS
jgi:ribosomal protein L22